MKSINYENYIKSKKRRGEKRHEYLLKNQNFIIKPIIKYINK